MSLLDFSGLNWLAILVATLAGIVIWAVVSMPFKSVFVKGGITEERFDEYNKSAQAWILGIITQIIAVIVLALLLKAAAITDIGSAIIWVVLVGIGFIFCQTINMDRGFKRSLSFTILNTVLFIAAFSVSSVVLILWT